MRKFVPLIIIIVAIVAYEARDQVSFRVSPPERGSAASARSSASIVPRSGGIPTIPAPAAVSTRSGEIDRGTSFFVAMRRVGVDPTDIHHIVQSSKDVFNFRRVKPGQRFTLFGNEGQSPDSLHYVIDTEHILRIARVEDRFVSRLDTVPYRVEHRITTGSIQNSIYESLQERGANPELAAHLAIIYQWDIDFFKDLRRGDTFTILYENKVYENGREQLGNVVAARVVSQGRAHHAFAFRSGDGALNYYDMEGNSLQKSLLRAPLRYQRISSNFTHRRLHPVTRQYKPHLGVDYVAPRGTPVRSTGDGVVVAATRDRGNGNYVKIRHNSRYTTYYLHLQGFAEGIRRGVRVKQGQVIGYLGATGLVTAAHLDYRIKVGGKFVNPRTVRLPSKEPVADDQRAAFDVARSAYLVAFLQADTAGSTVVVERPAPPLRAQVAAVFEG